MIPDEQIKHLAVSCGFKLTNETGDDLKPYVYEFARELIALAQQVKPLEFERDEYGVLFVDTDCGNYEIHHTSEVREVMPVGTGFYFERNCRFYVKPFKTEAEAIEAAQQDYQRRALGCLVNGGV